MLSVVTCLCVNYKATHCNCSVIKLQEHTSTYSLVSNSTRLQQSMPCHPYWRSSRARRAICIHICKHFLLRSLFPKIYVKTGSYFNLIKGRIIFMVIFVWAHGQLSQACSYTRDNDACFSSLVKDKYSGSLVSDIFLFQSNSLFGGVLFLY